MFSANGLDMPKSGPIYLAGKCFSLLVGFRHTNSAQLFYVVFACQIQLAIFSNVFNCLQKGNENAFWGYFRPLCQLPTAKWENIERMKVPQLNKLANNPERRKR